MNGYHRKYTNLKKTHFINNKNNLIINNTIEKDNNSPKQKSLFKLEKLKDSIIRDNYNSNKINNTIKKVKINLNTTKNIYCKKRANSLYDSEKINDILNNENIVTKKLVSNKSYVNIRNNNERDNINNYINNKIIKKKMNNSRNKKSFYNNANSNNKIRLRKKIIYNTENKTIINNIDIFPINGEKFNKTYLTTHLNNNSSNKNIEKDYISVSQNLGDEQNNIIKNKNISSIQNDDNKIKIITDINNEKKLKLNYSNNNFFIKKQKNSYDYKNNNNKKKNNINNDFSYNTKYEEGISNFGTENENNKNIINNSPKKKQRPIKIYNDNTSINLEDSYNLDQYFNTIMTNKNNENNFNTSIKNKKVYNNYHYKLSPQKNNITNIYNKSKEKNKLYNTQLNSNENNKNNKKNNNVFINEYFNNNKFIETIDFLQEEMNEDLKYNNPTNSKSRKYNTLKHYFEKFLKVLNNYFYNNDLNILFSFLQKLLIGYHEVVSAFWAENLKFKELNYKLNEEYQILDKNLIESNKRIKEKQKKIEILENKLNELVYNFKNNNISRNKSIELNMYKLTNNNSYFKTKNKLKTYNSDYGDNIFEKNVFKQNNKIKKINEKNLDDLDALYFYDKIEMKGQRSLSNGKNIPLIPIKKK